MPRQAEPLVRLLAMVTLIQALATFAVLALPTLAPRAAQTFAVTPEDVGYQISVIYAAAAAMSVFAGLLVRRFGAGRVSLAAMAAGASGLLGIATGSVALALAGSVVLGIGYGLTNPAASHLLVRFAPQGRRNLIFAIKQAGVPLGGVVASLLLPSLSERIGWQAAVAASVVMFAAIAVPLLRLMAHWDDDRDATLVLRSAGFPGLATVFSDPTLIALAVLGCCYAGYQFCLLAFTITMLVADLGWGLVEAGLAATAVQLAGIGGRIGWSMLADRLGRGDGTLIAIGLASAALGLATAGLIPRWPAAGVVLVLAAFGWCIVGWNGVYMGETTRASGAERAGLATGGVLVFNFIGVIAMPALFALASKLTGSFAATFGAFAVLPLIGAGALLRARLERTAAATD